MAADVGSMFQYWKKFDLRRLQVSAILTFPGSFLQRYVLLLYSGVCYPILGECKAKASGVCIDSY